MVRYTNLPDNKDKPFGGAYSVHDVDTCKIRDQSIFHYSKNPTDPEQTKKDYLNNYKEWMFSVHPNIVGWQDYNEMCFTQGTTESFAQFYIKYRHKRLRISQGEYFYHQMMKGLRYRDNFAWLDQDDIRPGDVLLISVPFSDTGKEPKNLDALLRACDDAKVPVMLDLAYVNLAVDMQIDLTHKCIEYVVSSLSKVFPVELHRIGIRLQRTKSEDQLYVVNETNYNYINVLSAYIGNSLMQNFPADYIYKKYKSQQQIFCKKLNVDASPCVYFGIDHNKKFDEYNRGSTTNRLCFSRIWDGRFSWPV